MSQITTLEKVESGKKITDGVFKITLKKIFHPILMLTAGSKVTYKVKKDNIYTIDKNKPTIFAVNHQCSQDIPIACRAIKKHGYLLLGKQPLEGLDEFFFNTNGNIFVDRKDKKDMALSKKAMVEYLKKGQNIIMFPEGTWNMHEAMLMLNMKWGIIEIAKETNAQIVPVVLNYERESKTCNVVFGKTMLIDQNKDKKDAIGELRDEMATLRWNFIAGKKTYKREALDIEMLRKQQEEIYAEYPKLDVEYEKSVIFNPQPSSEDVFNPVKKIGIRKNTAFLYGRNKKGTW